MAGQATITLKDKIWNVTLAVEPWELTQGLGGFTSIQPGTGMLFDLGAPQIIQVTTEPMFFPLDIAFLSESLAVTEVYRDIQPGYIVTSTQPARFFLEVNAGELEGVDAGDAASVQVILLAQLVPDWSSMLVEFMGFSLMAFFIANFVKGLVQGFLKKPEKKRGLYGPRGEELLPDTRPLGKFFIQADRMGDIIVTRPGEPKKSIFLQFEADKEIIYDLLRDPEKEELDKGWEVEIGDSEPRASTLWELWDSATLVPSTKARKETQNKLDKPTREDVGVDSWVERDRIGIWLTDKRTDKTVAEWWDEDAAQMFEDGFFKPGHIRNETITGPDFEKSVLDYAEYIGILKKPDDKPCYLPQTVRESESIEVPFKDAPSWVQEEWKKLHSGSIPRVHVHRVTVARIDVPVFEYAVRDIAANKAGRTVSRYVPAYDALLTSSSEEKALYFGGAIRLGPDEAIAVMDFWGDRFKSIDLYVNPAAYEPPKLVAPSLTSRQMKILATIRSYTSAYRREVFELNKVNQAELDELQRLGLIDRRGALTVTGRNVVGREEPLSSYLPQTDKCREEPIDPRADFDQVAGGGAENPKEGVDFELKTLPPMEGPSLPEAFTKEFSLTPARLALIQYINKLISQRTKYGLREETVEKIPAYELVWSNAGANWYIWSLAYQRKGQLVKMDANHILVQGIRKAEIEAVLKWLNPLPLYSFSYEAKERGIYDPIGHLRMLAQRWLEEHGEEGLQAATHVRPEERKVNNETASKLKYLPDSPEFLTQTIEDIGYRDRIDRTFMEAIERARKGERRG